MTNAWAEARRRRLFDDAMEMEPEDGVIWVYGVGEDGVMAFTDFGIESLVELIKMYKDDPAAQEERRRKLVRCGLRRMDAQLGRAVAPPSAAASGAMSNRMAKDARIT